MSPKTIKSIIFGVLTLGACLLFWYFLHALFYAESSILNNLIWTLLFFFIFVVLSGLTCFLIDSKAIAFPLLTLCALSFFLFFGFKIGYLIGIILFLIALFAGYLSINSEKRVRIRVSLRKSLGYGLPLVLTFSIIMICIAYYFAPAIQAQAREITIPKQMFDAAVAPAEGVISGLVPGFKKSMTVDEFTFLMTLSTLEKQEEFELPPEAIEFLKEEGVDIASKQEVFEAIRENPRVREKFMEMFREQEGKEEGGQGLFEGLGIEVKGDEPFLDAIYKAANQKLNEVLGPYRKYIPLAASVSLFFILRILMIPFDWLVMSFAWLLFALLKAVKVVRIEKVQKEVETIAM